MFFFLELYYLFTHLPDRRVWPILWYSGPVLVIAFEEEQEEAVGEPQYLVEWQADNVM